MAKKIRNIYKGNQPLNYVEIEGTEPLLVVATNENCSEAIVYSKANHCTITITYGATTLEYEGFQGDTLKNIAATLNESAINTAVTGQSFSYWYIINNGTGEEISPSSSAQIADCLNNVVINGDITITAIYNLNTYKLHVYDYDHTTILQSITVNYGDSYENALKSFDTSKLTSPDIDTQLYAWGHNGWTLEKNSNIQDTSLSSKTIISESYIYPCYSVISTITYTMNFHIYSEENNWQWIDCIELRHNQSYNDAIDEGQPDVLSNYSHKDLGTSERFYNTDTLFFDPLSDAFMTKDTPLENIQNWVDYSNNTINLYIGYTDVVKTYSVKLYDELAGIYLYQNTEIIHGTKIFTIEDLGTQISNILLGNYHSTLENSHYTYTYWLEYVDGTKYTTNDVVTSHVELIIRYTSVANTYTITWACGDSLTDYEIITTSTAKYNEYFYVPSVALAYLNEDGIYTLGSTDTLTSYEEYFESTSNSNRTIAKETSLRSIKDETFVIVKKSQSTFSTTVKVLLSDNTEIYSTTLTSGTAYSLSTAINKAFDYSKSTTSSGYKTTYSTDYVKVTTIANTNSPKTDYNEYKVTSAASFPINNTSGYSSITLVVTTKETTEALRYTVNYMNADMTTVFWSTTVAYGTKYKDIPRPSGVPKDAGSDVFKWWSAHGSGLNMDSYPDSAVYSDMRIYPCYVLNQTAENYPTSDGIHIYNPAKKLWTCIMNNSDYSFLTKTIEASTSESSIRFTVYARGFLFQNLIYARVSTGNEVVQGTTSLGNGYWGLSGQLPSASSPSYVSQYAEPVLYSHGPNNFTEELTVTVYLKNGLFNDLTEGESATYGISLKTPTASNGNFAQTDNPYYFNNQCVKIKVTKTSTGQVGGGD